MYLYSIHNLRYGINEQLWRGTGEWGIEIDVVNVSYAISEPDIEFVIGSC